MEWILNGRNVDRVINELGPVSLLAIVITGILIVLSSITHILFNVNCDQ